MICRERHIRGLLKSGHVKGKEKEKLRERYRELDLYQLKCEIDRLINRLYRSVKRKVA